jgi:hypothetical protein
MCRGPCQLNGIGGAHGGPQVDPYLRPSPTHEIALGRQGCQSLDVRQLHRKDLLRRGLWFDWSWTRNNEPAGNIGILTEHDAIVLIYRSRPYGSTEWKGIRQRVPITWTECHFGGRRPWFRCTVYARGRYCGRRVATIYHAGDVFACRRCCGLVPGIKAE